MNKVLIVGSGFSGACIARELANAGLEVDLIEKRDHLAGNAFDYVNEHGIRVHKYGPHLFHTSDMKVVDWLSNYTEWTEYRHKVKALLDDGRLVTLPVNLETINIVGSANILDVFFRPYSKKMWGIDFNSLDPSIANRVPVRDDFNEFYFPNDSFQALPKNGYAELIFNILKHDKINVALNTEFNNHDFGDYAHIFNSMPIDEYFDYSFGRLPYRSVKFHNYTIPVPKLFPVATINFTHHEKFTRVTEWKNLPNHGVNHAFSSITIEEPCDYIDNNYERFYPVKDLNGENIKLFQKYKSCSPSNMTFIGRCGLYAYLDMHQAVSSSLSIARKYLATLNL